MKLLDIGALFAQKEKKKYTTEHSRPKKGKK